MGQSNDYIEENSPSSPHTFHIPVMGTGFTIDTPIHVARYGISSVISLVDDVLIEQMRKYYCEKEGIPYEEISKKEEDFRARRITAYLDLIYKIVQEQVKTLTSSDASFEVNSDLSRYFRMLPDCPLKKLFTKMRAATDEKKRIEMQDLLRRSVAPGSIDVNIMTKLDKDKYRNGKKLDPEFSDASSALRGYAKSLLSSSIIFSAGLNSRLFAYLDKFDDFFPDEKGTIKKKIVLKVSDYRSAFIQGKYLAKRCLWVSEFRVESGLNCGGHAFVSDGKLLGPILEEFKQQKEELIDNLLSLYTQALLEKRGKHCEKKYLTTRITVQGGIVTAAENESLLRQYAVDGTGWGTPFLLVPEVCAVDTAHLQKLVDATEDDVYLSTSSPLGVPFWTLRHSASEDARDQRILTGKPGSLCPRGFAVTTTEFTNVPICTASRGYQRRKLKQLGEADLSEEQRAVLEGEVLSKACICRDLAGAATKKYNLGEEIDPAICCGPSIAYFTKIAKLDEMVSHIYGRQSLLSDAYRPHMFIKEIKLYIDYLQKELKKHSLALSSRSPKYFTAFKENLLNGIDYYYQRANDFIDQHKDRFLLDLNNLKEEIINI